MRDKTDLKSVKSIAEDKSESRNLRKIYIYIFLESVGQRGIISREGDIKDEREG